MKRCVSTEENIDGGLHTVTMERTLIMIDAHLEFVTPPQADKNQALKPTGFREIEAAFIGGKREFVLTSLTHHQHATRTALTTASTVTIDDRDVCARAERDTKGIQQPGKTEWERK